MCYADAAGILQIDPPPNLPYLLELVGENPGANNQCPFLLPIATIQKLKTALSQEYPIPTLGASLVAFENVLPPRSQETIACFQDGLQAIKKFATAGGSARSRLWQRVFDAIGSAGVVGVGGKDSCVGSLAGSGCNDPI